MTIRTEPAERRPGTVKLDRIRVEDIKYRLAEGESRAALAKEYGLAPYSIGSIARGETWADVPGPDPDDEEPASSRAPAPEWIGRISLDEASRVATSALDHAFHDLKIAEFRAERHERKPGERLKASDLAALKKQIRDITEDVQFFVGPDLELLVELVALDTGGLDVDVTREAYRHLARPILKRLSEISLAADPKKFRLSGGAL